MDAEELKKIVAEATQAAINKAAKKPRAHQSTKKDDGKDGAWKQHLDDEEKKLPLKQQKAAGYQKLNASVVAKKIVATETEQLWKELTLLQEQAAQCEKKLNALAKDSKESDSSDESDSDSDATPAKKAKK